MSLELNGTTGVQGNSGAFVAGTAVASTSGTSIDFTSIPSWVKRITVSLKGVSTNGTSLYLAQLGTSGGIVTSGYSSGASSSTSTAGLLLLGARNANDANSGQVIITLQDSANTWVCSSNLIRPTVGQVMGAGYISLAGTLDRIRITTVNGTDTFNGGSINILYE